ncbi:hypothetical protein GCM10022386_01740 [Flavobacterium cheonhonense]|uniref:Uncharacterized protein n=1 Tax=Flavobacterium cheonhonense TaxID=706185 RepID=A0ABP7T836_9FLAO
MNSFDKQTGKHIPTNINNICAETDLYTLDDNREINNDILAVEKIYANFVEPRYQKAYNLLTDDTVFRITDEQRIKIIIGILQLYMRNPRHLKNGVAVHTTEISKQHLAVTEQICNIHKDIKI